MGNFLEILNNPAIGIPISLYIAGVIIGLLGLLIGISEKDIKTKKEIKSFIFKTFFWPLIFISYLYKSYKEIPNE